MSHTLNLVLPRNPALAAEASCVPMGMIGVTLGGVAIFNALDDAGRDDVAHEVQDQCNGHPQMQGQYHFHGPPPCMPGINSSNTLMGYALDGFGIYSNHDENGRELTNKDLDACHGRTSPVMWDGQLVTLYHYVLTHEYPYTVGCFRGTPTNVPRLQRPATHMTGAQGRLGPPAEAVSACNGQPENNPCQFTSPRGDTIQGICRQTRGGKACVPAGGPTIEPMHK